MPAYSAQEDEFTVTLLQESFVGADIRVKVYPTIIHDLDHPDKRQILSNILPVFLDLKFDLSFTTGADNLLRDVGLKLELLDISGPLIDLAETQTDDDGNPIFSKADTLASLKQQIDRTVPFSAAGDGKIAAIQLKKFFADDDTPNAIGVYINLVLQNGPRSTDLLPDRGNVDDAQNFLPKDSHMAFGFAADTYQRLAEDLFQKQAVLKAGTTDEFEYPIVQDGETKGKIKGISIYPETRRMPGPGGGNSIEFTNVLVIDVNGEYKIAERKILPALLIVQGDADEQLGIEPARRAFEALKQRYVGCGEAERIQFEVIRGLAHNFGPGSGALGSAQPSIDLEIEQKTKRWFERFLCRGPS